MSIFSKVGRPVLAAALASAAGGAAAQAATYVYVSNSDDGEIRSYRMSESGELLPLELIATAKMLMPLAISPDRRFLFAGVRSKPYSVYTFAIDPTSGRLDRVAVSPLHESFPFIAVDTTGRYLFGASYSAHLLTVNAIGPDGRVAPEPTQVIPVGRHAHAVRIDAGNRFLFVPTLGTDQIFQFTFDAARGVLASNTPAVVQMEPGAGPRHFVFAPDNRHVYVLSELLATVTTYRLDAASGRLEPLGSAAALPSDSGLRPGAARAPTNSQAAGPVRDTSSDIWAADIHATPDGRFVYVSERTSSVIAGFAVSEDGATLRPLGTTPTERQPRGFNIDPTGRFLVACGEKSDTVTSYAIDPTNGSLRRVGTWPGGHGANWVEFVRLP